MRVQKLNILCLAWTLMRLQDFKAVCRLKLIKSNLINNKRRMRH